MRRRAESRMVDTCRIQQPTADVWDAVTATYEPGPPVFSYEGICEVKYGSTQARTVDVAGQRRTLQIVEVRVPMGTSTEVDVGHVVEVLTSATDPGLVGRKFRVDGRFGQTHAASRRFPVEEVSTREG